MKKLKMQTPDLTGGNIAKIAELFPSVVTEREGNDGVVEKAVDFDLLRQALQGDFVEGDDERYRLDWPGKRASLLKANTPIDKTLRPDRESSVNFDSTQNLFIEGDNFEVLKVLQESYLGEVKMIYIDPPYNTGNDFVYKDNFTQNKEEYEEEIGAEDEEGGKLFRNTDSNGRFHSDWLSMMYERLVIARDLLADDGIIMISIDETEHANLRKLSEEVFGEANYCGDIVVKNSSKNDQQYVSIQHENYMIFVKDKSKNNGQWVEKKEGLDQIYKAFDNFKKDYGADWNRIHEASLEWYKQFPASSPISSSKHYNWMDEKGVYFASDISGPNDGQYVYNVVHPVTKQICKAPSRGWRCPESEMIEQIKKNLVHFGEDETSVPNNKTYLKETEYQSLVSIKF